MASVNQLPRSLFLPKDFTYKSADAYIDVKSVAANLGVSVATVHRLRKSDGFPKARAISVRCVRWRRSEIEAWSGTRDWCFATEFAV